MGRYGNYPTTVEDCLTFRLKSLTENNNSYLSSYGTRIGVTSWSRNGEVFAKIDIEVNHYEHRTFIIFDYSINGEPKRYRVNLRSKISNLGKGKIWYFVCPHTGKLSRKLYLQSGYFLHRTASKNLMYSKQIESKKNRDLHKIIDACFIPDSVYEERYKKYFKTHYKGKPTKKYLKFERQIEASRKFPPSTLERLMLL